MSEPTRILLSEAASKHLLKAGECFMIAGKSSHPEQPGRIVLHLVPIDKPLADAACLVAMGQARATRPRSTPAAKVGAATGHPEGQGDRPPPPPAFGSFPGTPLPSATSPHNLPRHHDSQGRNTHTETP